MVKPFRFAGVPEIHFGSGSFSELPSLCHKFGRNLVIVTGKNAFLNSQKAEVFLSAMKLKGLSWHLISVEGEPSPEVIDGAVQSLANENIDLIVGIGGGSVLDAGKAISAMIGINDTVADYLEVTGTKLHPGSKIPFIAVPTTSGTGSEATKNAVISKVGKDGFKRSLRHDNFVPEIALVDPELTVSCPPAVTAASGMDCFTQLAEAYLSVKAVQYTDALVLEGLKAVKNSLIRVCRDGSDIEARTGMSFAALTSGICLANAGLGVVHGFASSLGARYNIPHGVICGTLMSSANQVNVRVLREAGGKDALVKYVTLGKLFLDKENAGDDYYIDGFIDYLFELSDKIGLPGLKSAWADASDFPEIIEQTDCKNNPVKLSRENLNEILDKRYF
jgi:alcohol dehydrogenase class IV